MTAPFCCVITPEHDNARPYGVVIIDKKHPTMYDVFDGVELWLTTVMRATDIEWKQGYYGRDSSQVHCTIGGAAPYRATFNVKSCEDNVLIKEEAK